MLGECLEIFKEQLEAKGEDLILNTYIPKSGTYIIVNEDGDIVQSLEIEKQVDKNVQRFSDICYFDYYSSIINTNKAVIVPEGKILHSNNYLSFFIKKEDLKQGKLTQELIEKYYNRLESIEEKYNKSVQEKEIYAKVKTEIGDINIEILHKCKNWVLNNIFALENLGIDILRGGNYLKIFFDADKQDYKREGIRYTYLKMYNDNKYTMNIRNQIYGVPYNNQCTSDKKPFFNIKTRTSSETGKCAMSYLLNMTDALLQKQFFDYLLYCYDMMKYTLYVDMERRCFTLYKNSKEHGKLINGFLISIEKISTKQGVEVIIKNQDNIPFYNIQLGKPFVYKNWLNVPCKNNGKYEFDKELDTYPELGQMIDKIFFLGNLRENYFTEEKKITIKDDKSGRIKRNLLLTRDRFYRWFYYGDEVGMEEYIDKFSLNMIKNSIIDGNFFGAALQFNLRLSLIQYFSEGGKDMADFSVGLKQRLKKKLTTDESVGLEDDREYYFAVGQMAGYLIYQSKSSMKKQSLINPFLNARNKGEVKELILRYYKKYNYDIPVGAKKVSKLYAIVMGYEPNQIVMQDMISLGFTMSNLLLEKEEKEKKNDE